MHIPNFFDKDDYLQNPIMRRFLREQGKTLPQTRPEYIRDIESFANETPENEMIVHDWLLNIAKEGSKEICFRRITGIKEWHRDPMMINAKLGELFPDCPQLDLLNYTNTDTNTLIEYKTVEVQNEIKKIEFTFSQRVLCGETGTQGEVTIFPVFIEIYLDSGFITSRCKAKSTIFEFNSASFFLDPEKKMDTAKHAVTIIDQVALALGLDFESDAKKVKFENSKMLFNLYRKFSFTPEDVESKVKTQEALINAFVAELFDNLNLDVRNKEKAIVDAQIFVEKFLSINGDNQNIFKEDRPAYLIKISADDSLELTKIDATSDKTVPLQCTEAFFDSKKTVVKSGQCKRLSLVFKRKNDTYFPKSTPLTVQIGSAKNYGYIKTMQYAEEVDIQNVLQAVFESYRD